MLTTLGRFLADQVWPVLAEVVVQPLLWLAVAALVYGSRVLSLAELWRRGQPYAARVPGADRFARFRDRHAARRVGPAPRGLRWLGAQTQEAFFGDLSDKYLPTVHSLRLVLRAGLLFLGSFVLAYAALQITRNVFSTLLHATLGGHLSSFWVVWEPVLDLLENAPFEPLRICLLAVAFRRCLEVFALRRPPLPPGGPATDHPATAAVTG